MMNDQKHQMIMIKSHNGGAEEWICPDCGRRILIEWPPDFRKIVLDEGDTDVAHSGARGGLIMGMQEIIDFSQEQVPANTTESDVNLDIDESRLEPWARWLDANGFKDL